MRDYNLLMNENVLVVSGDHYTYGKLIEEWDDIIKVITVEGMNNHVVCYINKRNISIVQEVKK